MRDWDFVRSQPVGVRHLGDGIAVPSPSDAARRVRRYLLLSGAQELTYPYWSDRVDRDTGEITKRSEFRLAICGREPVADEVRIYRHGPTVGYGGLMRCGNVWGCVVCSAKVLRRRAEQIGALFQAVHASGGSAVMVTFTAGHKREDRLIDLLTQIKTALRRMSQSRGYRDVVSDRSGMVVAAEITWGERNGWHPHSHQAWFFPFCPSPDCDRLADLLFPLWQKACAGVGLETREFFRGRRVGVDVRPAWDASEYLAKFDRERDWDLPSEMTAGRMKVGRASSLTPWGLLEDAILRGRDSPAAELWIEYLRATKGYECVSLRGARALLVDHGLPTTYDDWVDANAPGEGQVLGTLSARSFDRVVRQGGLGQLLEAARSAGLPGIAKELGS